MSFNRTEPRVLIIDENEIHFSEPFNYQPTTTTTQIIIRMPAVPTEYFQVSSFSAWYESRLHTLNAYAASQNTLYAGEPIHFDVMVGSKHEVLRAFKTTLDVSTQSQVACVC